MRGARDVAGDAAPMRHRALAGLVLVATVAGAAALRPAPVGAQMHAHGAGDQTAVIDAADVVIPALEGAQLYGGRVFAAKCVACHGDVLTGVEGAGPPLLHDFYVPGHHSDGAIEAAVRRGAPAHHWPFGDMPAVKGLTGADIAAVIGYIRAVQQANGIR